MATKKLLIVDDEPELRDLLSITFGTRDFKIFTAQDGEEGLKLVASKKPDLIILDIKMPRLNGYEFLSRMRKDEKTRSIPIVVLTSITGDSGRTDEEWAQSLEVEDFISKPVEPFDLLERVERVLAAQQSA